MAKGLSAGRWRCHGIVLLLLLIAFRVGAQEADVAVDAFLDARLQAARERGGEKEVRRVLLDDLSAYTDHRSDEDYVRALLDRVSKENVVEAMSLLKQALALGNPDNAGAGTVCRSFFSKATETWVKLACSSMTSEEKLKYLLGMRPDMRVPPMDPALMKAHLLHEPKPALRTILFEFLNSTEITSRDMDESVLKIWLCEAIEDVLNAPFFQPKPEELELLLRSRNTIGRTVAFRLLCTQKTERGFALMLEWLKSDDPTMRGRALLNCAHFTSVDQRQKCAEIVLTHLQKVGLDTAVPESIGTHWGLLTTLAQLGKQGQSLAAFRQERNALKSLDLQGISKDAWDRLFWLREVVDRTLAEWEKE